MKKKENKTASDCLLFHHKISLVEFEFREIVFFIAQWRQKEDLFMKGYLNEVCVLVLL